MQFRRYVLFELAFGFMCAASSAQASEIELRVVSSRSDAVSGGGALVQLEAPRQSGWSVSLNGRDVTSSFQLSARSGKFLARLNGLKLGKNTLKARTKRGTTSKVEIINYPSTGPIFSGPQQQPFVCRTEANGLGPALDEHCSANSIVRYYYKSTEPATPVQGSVITAAPVFKPFDRTAPRPSDLAQTTLRDGRTVDYIVRREIGVINRAVYEIQFLHQPDQPLPTPWSGLTPGWNGRLVYTFGGGCGAGHHQGILSADRINNYELVLAQGYALAGSTLNILGVECNDRVSAETASMVKGHFIEEYGEPAYTIAMGGSGGALSVLIAQNYPGILDGAIVYLSAPDMLTTVIPVFSDCALMHRGIDESSHSWTEAQKTAVSGFATWQACPEKALWLDPSDCDASLKKELVYDRISNPKGVRCDYYSGEINVFGRDPSTGFARRTLDNVGIQYGIVALNAGKIDAEQFIELNERMGGFDADGQMIRSRSVADSNALRIAFQKGVLVSGRGLADIPIIDWNRYADDLGDFHTRDRTFLTRERLIAANGHADNQVVIVTPRIQNPARPLPGVGLHVLVPQMDLWLAKIAADTGSETHARKIVRNKPAELADGCIATDGERIFEPASYKGPGRCNHLYPFFGNPRVAAGAPIAGDIMKCALKPIDPADYVRPFTPEQLQRLQVIFQSGVCDYSKPGVGEGATPTVWYKIPP